MYLTIHTDGGARGNPGPAGIGVVISDTTGNILEEHAQALGVTTNNQAEYRAVLFGLERALTLGATTVNLVTDSELLVRQANGEYRVKNPELLKLFLQLKNLELRLGKRVTYRHVRRELNKRADALANKAMDQARAGGK